MAVFNTASVRGHATYVKGNFGEFVISCLVSKSASDNNKEFAFFIIRVLQTTSQKFLKGCWGDVLLLTQ